MLFHSLEFLFFFIIVFSIYCLKPRWNRWLLIASYFFYGFWDYRFLALIWFSTVVDYICTTRMDTCGDAQGRKFFLWVSLISNLLILAFFKYANFFVDNFNSIIDILGFPINISFIKIVLPVGISFYTFQAISYVVDVYRREIKPTRNFIDFALFIAFFPQLVAGPIERAGHLLSQIVQPRILNMSKFSMGCFLFFWGFFEKVFVAQNMANIANPVFANFKEASGGEILIALYAFSFQIFCDFDAYSNMAKGIALCMGFELIFNFNLPYFSSNPSEFWRRWHISLSTWLRDYLYIPLGGNRGTKLKTVVNLLFVMTLGGLWHGAAWTFVLWGLIHGLLLVLHRVWIWWGKNRFIIWPWVRIFVFYHIIILTWLPFRAQSLDQLKSMAWTLFFNFQWSVQTTMMMVHFLLIVVFLWVIQWCQYRKNDLLFLYHQNKYVKTVVYAFMTYLIVGWGIMKPEQFIYFQF